MALHCMKYFNAQQCPDYVRGEMRCDECAFRLRELVEMDKVHEIINQSESKLQMIEKLSHVRTVSTCYLSYNAAEYLAGEEE